MKEVILAAGFGSRLWPLSTSEAPKQFQPLIDGRSLLQNTYETLRLGSDESDVHVLTLQGLEHMVFEQIPDISPENVLLVPERRNTLPHTLFAINSLTEGDEPVLFAGVDQATTDTEGFVTALDDLRSQSKSDTISLLCGRADRIDTTLGYVEADASGAVRGFVEKPPKDKLQELMEGGSLFSFHFFFTASRLALKAALRDHPDDALVRKSLALLDSPSKQQAARLLDMPIADISKTVLQHAQNLRLCVGRLGLIDIGKYSALYEINSKDEQGNVIFGDVIVQEGCENNFIVNQTKQPLVVIGTSDSVVVQTLAGTITAPINQADIIGEIYKNQILQRAS